MRKVKKNEDQLNSFGKRMRDIRGDLSQTDFADILRIQQSMVSRYESNYETPSPMALLRIAQFSGRSVEWLLTGKDTVPPANKVERKQGAREGKTMSKEGNLEMASSCIIAAQTPESGEFVEMMQDLFGDKKRMRRILDYHRFLRFEGIAKPRK